MTGTCTGKGTGAPIWAMSAATLLGDGVRGIGPYEGADTDGIAGFAIPAA